MTIIWNAALLRFEVSYQTAEFQTLRDAGFELERKSGILWTKDHSNVENLRGRASIKKDALAEITNRLLTAQQNNNASQATNSDIQIPVPQGLALLPFQRAGVAYFNKANHFVSGVLIADEMGL